MARVGWSEISIEIKKKIYWDLYNELQCPCDQEGFICPMESYGLDCEKDNDNHCLFKDFYASCLVIIK